MDQHLGVRRMQLSVDKASYCVHFTQQHLRLFKQLWVLQKMGTLSPGGESTFWVEF